MTFIFVLVIVSLVVESHLTVATFSSNRSASLQQRWAVYKEEHGKSYPPGEDYVRMMLFLMTESIVAAHNALNSRSYTLGLTQFADLTANEKSKYFGLVIPTNKVFQRGTSQSLSINEDDRRIIGDPASIESLDYRTHPCMGPVKEQGKCGSCWAYTAINAVEFNHCKNNGMNYVSLSEQQVLDCDVFNYGCTGGWPSFAFGYLQSNGALRNSSYPYIGVESPGGCQYDPVKNSTLQPEAKVLSYSDTEKGEAAMKVALANYGPLSVLVYASNHFTLYKSGVFSEWRCTRLGIREPNHAVNVVGFGRQSTLPFLPYWIVRNQWGTSWGEGGYMRILRGVNMCGIESHPIYAVVD